MKVAIIMGSASDADKMEACIHILKDFGADTIQGYYFSKPLSADEAIAYKPSFEEAKK